MTMRRAPGEATWSGYKTARQVNHVIVRATLCACIHQHHPHKNHFSLIKVSSCLFDCAFVQLTAVHIGTTSESLACSLVPPQMAINIHSFVPFFRAFPPPSFVFSRSVFKFLVIALVIPSTPAHRLKPFVFALLSLGPTRSHIRRNLASVHSDEFRAIMEYSNVYCSIFLATILYYFQRMLLLAFWVLYISPRLVLCSVA